MLVEPLTLLTWPIVRHWPSHLICAQIGTATRKIVIHTRKTYPHINSGRTWTQLKIKVRRLVERSRIRPRRRRLRVARRW